MPVVTKLIDLNKRSYFLMHTDTHNKKNLSDSSPSRKRVYFIDVTRGILIIWMILSHAIGRAEIPSHHIFQLLRPHGWATYGFVMVSGFSIGYLFRWTSGTGNDLQHKLLKRALQIAAIAYFSNLIFISAKLFLGNKLNLEILFKIATFQYPWGYSSILIPTTLLLLIAPWLLKKSSKNSPIALLIASSVIVTIVSFLVTYYSKFYMQSPVFQVLFTRNHYVVFPIGYLFLYAIWAFTFANFVRNYQQWKVLFTVVVLSITIYGCAHNLYSYDSFNPHASFVISRFPLIILISVVICTLPFTKLIKDGLGLIGRSALLIYIIHRPLLEVLDLLLNDRFEKIELAYLLILFAIIFNLFN